MTNEEAIKNIVAYMYYAEDIPEEVVKAFDVAIEALKDERPHGDWIKDIQGDTICSNCGFECLYNEEGMYSLGRYCHHCGADMKETDNE